MVWDEKSYNKINNTSHFHTQFSLKIWSACFMVKKNGKKERIRRHKNQVLLILSYHFLSGLISNCSSHYKPIESKMRNASLWAFYKDGHFWRLFYLLPPPLSPFCVNISQALMLTQIWTCFDMGLRTRSKMNSKNKTALMTKTPRSIFF